MGVVDPEREIWLANWVGNERTSHEAVFRRDALAFSLLEVERAEDCGGNSCLGEADPVGYDDAGAEFLSMDAVLIAAIGGEGLLTRWLLGTEFLIQ